MSEHTPTQAGVEHGGGGGDPGTQIDEEMAQRLRAVTREFTRRELAELTGMSHETMRRYLDGQAPGPAFIKCLCETFGISADWLLLGRGLPVYQRDPPVADISGSIDELFEGLSRHLKRMHADLVHAEDRLRLARASQRRSVGRSAARDAPSPEVKPLPAAVEAAAADFVDPNELVSPSAGDADASGAGAGESPPRQVLVRLVLGPMNGRQLVLAEPASAEVRVRIGAGDRAELVPADDADDAGTQVYRRVFDRVYRWCGVTRGV